MPSLTRVLAAVLLAASACEPAPTAPVGTVEVSRVAGGVRLVNGTDRPVAYVVWNSGWLALFGPCSDPGPGCVGLAAGASVVVPDAEIAGSTPQTSEAVVRWWHVVPDGAGGYRADTVHEVTVRL